MDTATVRKFKEPAYYEQNGEYHLLPFRFHRLSNGREVLVNEVGDFLLVPTGTARRIATRQVSPHEALYQDLISRFFISRTPIPPLLDVMATRYRTKKSFLENFTALHIFVVTLRCNHACHYCQVSRVSEDRTSFDMSYTDLDRAIALMFRSPSPVITMEFQGGEPFLAFDKVQYAVERASELNEHHRKSLSFVVCSNLTVLTDEMLAFCQRYNVLLSTSLDGPPFIHNANRAKTGAASYGLVVEGIGRAREALGHDRVSALMTTTLLSLEHPIEIIDTYLQHQFSNVFLRPISPYGFALKNARKNRYQTEKFLAFYRTGLAYILELNRSGQFFVEDYTSLLLQKMLSPFATGYVDLQSPAGLVTSVAVYNYDGWVYASDEARMLAEQGDYTFRLGRVSDRYEDLFYGSLAQHLVYHGINEAQAGCSDCGFQAYCGADPVLHHATQGDLEGHKAFSVFCEKNMGILSHLFEMLEADKGGMQAIFYQWIRKRG